MTDTPTGPLADPSLRKQETEKPFTTDHNYIVADLQGITFKLEPERLFERSYKPQLRELVTRILKTEAPIFEDLLVRRIARAHGVRFTSELKTAVQKVIDPEFKRSKEGKRKLIWPAHADISQLSPFRPAPLSQRDHADIPLVERAALAKTCLAKSPNETVLCMKKELQLTRLLPKARKRLNAAVRLDSNNSSQSSIPEKHK